MAIDQKAGKRHVWGPRAVGSLIPAVVQPAFRRRSPVAAQLLLDWPAIVGPALEAVTTPRRLSGSTLTIACAGPVAMELQHMSTELQARINGYLGRSIVDRLRFVQDHPAAKLPIQTSDYPSLAPQLSSTGSTSALTKALARLRQAIQDEQPAVPPKR